MGGATPLLILKRKVKKMIDEEDEPSPSQTSTLRRCFRRRASG